MPSFKKYAPTMRGRAAYGSKMSLWQLQQAMKRIEEKLIDLEFKLIGQGEDWNEPEWREGIFNGMPNYEDASREYFKKAVGMRHPIYDHDLDEGTRFMNQMNRRY